MYVCMYVQKGEYETPEWLSLESISFLKKLLQVSHLHTRCSNSGMVAVYVPGGNEKDRFISVFWELNKLKES